MIFTMRVCSARDNRSLQTKGQESQARIVRRSSMEVTMHKSALISFVLSVVLSATGCQTKVEGFGVGNGTRDDSVEARKALNEETRKLQAARAESRAQRKSN